MKQIIKQLRKIAKFHDLKLKTSSFSSGADAHLNKDLIFLGYKDFEENELITAFFHELSHFYCMYEGKFAIFHDLKPVSECTTEELIIWVKTGLRAERYVDKVGKRIMALYYPDMEYESGYDNEYAGIIYKARIQLPIMLEIQRRQQEE